MARGETVGHIHHLSQLLGVAGVGALMLNQH